MLTFGNSKTKYYFDLDALMKWITTTPSNEKNVTTLITQTYPIDTEDVDTSSLNLATKEITETKSKLNDTMNNIRYDIVRNFVNSLLDTPNIDAEVEGDLEWLTFPQKLSFNTLLNIGIIKELKNTEINE